MRARLHPRDPDLSQLIGDAYHYLRRYPEAIEAYRITSAFAPDACPPPSPLGWSYFLWRGELDTLGSILRELPLKVDPGWGGGSLEHQRLILLLWSAARTRCFRSSAPWVRHPTRTSRPS